jgi:hypothetical protein
VRVAEDGVRLAESFLAMAKVRFEAGTAARLDVLRAEVEVANARAGSYAPGARWTSRTTRCARCCRCRRDRLELRGTLDDESTLPRRGRPARHRARPPRPAGHRHAPRRGRHGVAIASAEWKPSLALTGNLQFQEDGIERLLNATNRSYTSGSRCACRSSPRRRPWPARTGQAQVRQAEHGLRAAPTPAGSR